MKRLTRIYNKKEEFKLAVKALLDRGYQYDELKIIHGEGEGLGLDNLKEDLVQYKNSGNTTLRKSIKGLKLGVILGAIISGGIVGLILLFSDSGTSLSPIATFIAAISVGAVWGGVLGFMLGSLFPLSPHGKESGIRNYSLSFLPHNSEDELYFKNKWHTIF